MSSIKKTDDLDETLATESTPKRKVSQQEVSYSKPVNNTDLNNLSKEELLARLAAIEEQEQPKPTDASNEITEPEKIAVEEVPEEVETPSTVDSNVAFDISDIPDEDVESDVLDTAVPPTPVVLNQGVDFGKDIEVKDLDFNDKNDKPTSEVNIDEDEAKAERDFIKKQEDNFFRSYNNQKGTGKGTNTKIGLDNIVVDLNNIQINTGSPLQEVKDINTIFDSNVPTFTVVCSQSGYTASMSGLTLAEKNALINSTSDIYEARRRLYNTVYNKIQYMSIPKPDFNTWLKITAFGDLNTLLFGIYCQTFIDNNEFTVICGKCNKETTVTIDNQSLIEIRDKNVYAARDEIISGTKSQEELIKNSLVHKSERVMLSDSKIIVDVSNPSLHDHLSLMKMTNQDTLRQYAETFSAMLFIEHMYMLDVDATKRTGMAQYYEVTSKNHVLNILLKLSNADGEQLEDAIQEKMDKFSIGYEIHNVTCVHCGNKIHSIPIDIESVLFTRLNRTKTEE